MLSLRDITVDSFDKLSQFLSAPPTTIGAYLDTMSVPKLDVLIITGELNNVWSKIPSWYGHDQKDDSTQIPPHFSVKIAMYTSLSTPEQSYIDSEALTKLVAIIKSGYSLSITAIHENNGVYYVVLYMQ